MFVSNTISSRLLVCVAKCTAAVLLLMVVLSLWHFPETKSGFQFFVNVLVAVCISIFVTFQALKLASLRVITKSGSLFLVKSFYYRAEYEERTLKEVQVLHQRGLIWVRFKFESGGVEQIETTISQFDFLSNSDKFGISKELVKKMSWWSWATKVK